ncbi:MAG: hypothetical protein PVH40_06200 [Gemmatimonadales bacterium]|jgi:hypothetical protein
MHCHEFLELYSDYRDGLITDDAIARRMFRHVTTCRLCMQYDARISRGVTAMKVFSDLEPTRGFRGELDGRLARAALETEDPVVPGPAGLMVGLMVATALALVLWGGRGDHAWGPAQSVAVEQASPERAPLPAVYANPRPPFVSFADLRVPAFDPQTRTPGAGEGTFVRLTAGTE